MLCYNLFNTIEALKIFMPLMLTNWAILGTPTIWICVNIQKTGTDTVPYKQKGTSFQNNNLVHKENEMNLSLFFYRSSEKKICKFYCTIFFIPYSLFVYILFKE